MKKILALILTLVMMVTAFGAFAETTEGENLVKENFRVLPGLLEVWKNTPLRETGRSEEEIDAYCETIYGFIDPEQVGSVFYGGVEEMTDLMKKVHASLTWNDGVYWDAWMENSEVLYVYVWEILHDDTLPAEEKTRDAVKEKILKVFEGLAEGKASKAVDLCIDYIAQYEPERTDGDKGYTAYFDEGYRRFAEGLYTEAVESYRKCLEIRENDPVVSFMIAEAYIRMRDFDAAKEWLREVSPTLTGDENIAMLFRRLGFIAVEEGDYQLGYAWYAASLGGEESEAVRLKLDSILKAAPETRPFTVDEAIAYLKELNDD